MKKCLILLSLVLLTSYSAFAANFSPTTLKLAAPDAVQYDFDGSALEIPLTVSGTPATAVFLVHTKDQADNIAPLWNGHLGWHYVNKVDTCLFVSTPSLYDIGEHKVVWDGKDADGGMVTAGEYTYYFWGFDSVSTKILVQSTMMTKSSGGGMIQQYDADNNPLDNPVWYPIPATIPQLSAEDGGYSGGTDAGIKTRAKWILGGDPTDENLVETFAFMGWGDSGNIAFMPGDHSNFFVHNYIKETSIQRVRKFKYVPNGTCLQDTDWAEGGNYDVTNTSTLYAGPISDNVSSLWVIIADQSYPNIDNPTEIHYIDPETGGQLRLVDLADWWIDPVEWAKWDEYGYKMHAGPIYGHFTDGYIIGGGKSTCYRHLMNPYAEDDEDVTVWMNQNGDYIGDRYFEDDRLASEAWMCVGGSGAIWSYDTDLDANHFSIFSTYDLGALSFGILGPDGTGVEHFAFAGESADIKYGKLFCDNGSAFDGIYSDNNSSGDDTTKNGLWYVAHDSIKGTISSVPVAVEDDAPAAFAVAQNSPNPFNPSTTINFTIPEAGNISIEIFNVAGQKVDTIVSDFKDAGIHSTTWDASGFSAGVYFYTVKSGDFSKTMKMTLLK